jgi:Uma2 family endonuclease
MVLQAEAPTSLDEGVRARRWTRAEYYRMASKGIFGPEERVELIEGEIFQLSPPSPPHAVATDKSAKAVETAFGPGYYARVQQPLSLGRRSDPEPDVAVVTGSPDDYLAGHPDTALLVVEVSFRTLGTDRTTKAALYARYGIPDYWIVNLHDQQVEVLRDPGQLPDGTFGYRSRTVVPSHGAVRPVARPEAEIPVASLLPKAT